MPRERLTIVIPVLNEEAVLDRPADHLRAVLEGLDLSWEVLFVDDGSTDGSLAKLKDIHAADRRFSSISFSRNFGKEAAIAAGLRYARGDAVILMDADLQHPPNIIPRFIECWRQGYKIVFGQRQGRDGRFLRRLASRMFYASFRRVARTRLPAGVVDFLLLDRQAVDAINRLGEQTRFSKGLYAWIGFPSTTVPFTSGERESGASRRNTLKLAQFALDGFVSFTSLAFWNRKVAYLTGANLGLLLTHYFNVLFVAAQALFLLVYVLHRNRGVAPLGDLAKAAALSAVPVVLFLAIWGLVLPGFYEHYITTEGLSDRTSNPLSLFIAMVAHPNLGNSPLFSLRHLPGIGQLKAVRHSFWGNAPILLWLLGALVVTRLYYAVRNIPTHGASVRSYATVYFVFWALVPCLIAWLIFLSFSRPNEHLFPRYFAICSPALAVLLVLAIEQGVALASRLATRLRGKGFARHYVAYALLYTGLAAVILVLPDGQMAATANKENYRGIASTIANIVNSDPRHSYILYEVSGSRDLNYYLSKLDTKVRVYDYVPEGSRLENLLETGAREIAKHDYLILAFTHFRSNEFQGVLDTLARRYQPYLSLMNRDRGVIVMEGYRGWLTANPQQKRRITKTSA